MKFKVGDYVKVNPDYVDNHIREVMENKLKILRFYLNCDLVKVGVIYPDGIVSMTTHVESKELLPYPKEIFVFR